MMDADDRFTLWFWGMYLGSIVLVFGLAMLAKILGG